MNTVHTHVSQIGMGFLLEIKLKFAERLNLPLEIKLKFAERLNLPPDKNQLRKKV